MLFIHSSIVDGRMSDVPESFSTFRDLAGEIGRNVYVPDPIEGYKLGQLVDFHVDGLKIKLLEDDGNIQNIVIIPHNDVLPAEDDISKDVDDSCECLFSI